MNGPTRDQRRAAARAERKAAEEAARRSQQRRTRLMQLGGVLAAVVVIAVVVIVIAGGGSNDGSGPVTAATNADGSRAVLNNEAAINDRLAGIPQKDIRLGRADAPITVVEFGDMQCPACAMASQQVLPQVIDDYVRPGKAKLELRDIHFLGSDSVRMARFAAAAGQQDKYWNVAELMWHNQGEENTGYATDAYLRAIGQGVPGLDVDKAMGARNSPAVDERLVEAKRMAGIHGVQSTPTFLVGETGKTPKLVGADQLVNELEQLSAAQT